MSNKTDQQLADPTVDNGLKLIQQLMDSIKKKSKINLVCYVDDPECDLHKNLGNEYQEHQESPERTKNT